MSNKPYLPYMEFGPMSTQNRNMPAEYCLEQQQNKNTLDWKLNPNGAGGVPHTPAFTAGGSVPPSRIWRDQLSKNPIEIESWLFSLDQKLGDCPSQRKKFCPNLNYLPTLSFYEREKEVIMPKPLQMPLNQRAYPVPQK